MVTVTPMSFKENNVKGTTVL